MFQGHFCRAFIASFSPEAEGSFSRSRLRGTPGARWYVTTHVWVPAKLRRACSGHPKSGELALCQGICPVCNRNSCSTNFAARNNSSKDMVSSMCGITATAIPTGTEARRKQRVFATMCARKSKAAALHVLCVQQKGLWEDTRLIPPPSIYGTMATPTYQTPADYACTNGWQNKVYL